LLGGLEEYVAELMNQTTKQGKYMTEADAIAAGYRSSKEGPKK
jgi:hypothetical protein